MFVSALVRLVRRRAFWRASATNGAVLLRADETYRMLPPQPLWKLKRMIGRRVTVIDICGTEPTKPSVLIVANEGAGPKRFNRRATILLRGVPANNGDAVFGDAVFTQLLDHKGRVILRARKTAPESGVNALTGR
jgi:hypothetical protein